MIYSNKIEDSMRVNNNLQNSITQNDALSVVFKFELGSLVIFIGVLWAIDLLSVRGIIRRFSYANIFWIGAAIVALLIPLTLWKEKVHE